MRIPFFFSFFLIILSQDLFPQNLAYLKPDIGKVIEYSKQDQVLWTRGMDLLAKINSAEINYETLESKDKKIVDSIEMGYGPMTEGVGCSWYCGGGPYKMASSSILTDQGNTNYNPNNLHDFNLLTAWVPDTKTGIIGQKFNFHFKPFSPRVNEIVIWNGYFKNKELWKQNSRAKKLKLYINQKPYAILELSDIPARQSFKIDPIQSTDKEKDLTLTFEILEVYEGTKFKDLAISEINFSGLDVHCFPGETKITINDGKVKRIDHIKKGEKVITFNTETNEYITDEVDSIITVNHFKLYKLYFEDKVITTTDDHPFFIIGKGWCAINSKKANLNYYQETSIQELNIGDLAYYYEKTDSKSLRLIKMALVEKDELTYTLILKSGNSFIANGFIVKTEKEKIAN